MKYEDDKILIPLLSITKIKRVCRDEREGLTYQLDAMRTGQEDI